MKTFKLNINSGFMLTENMLRLPEVAHTIEKWKSKGFAMLMYMKFELKKSRNGIGSFKNIGSYARKMGIQKHNLIKMIQECEAYHYDAKRGLFWSPRMRKGYKLSIDPSEDELNDIMSNGTIYFGHDSETEKRAFNLDVFAKHSSNQKAQDTDNQEEYDSDNKSKVISNVSKEIVSEKADENKNSVCTDDDEVKEFKEILSSKSWCKSVTKRLGIDLTDDSTLNLFSEWMYVYCRSNEKKLTGKSELRRYAGNLLRQDTKTRAEFEKYADRNKCEEYESATNTPEEQSEYEIVVGDMRFSATGHHLPDWAPQQPSLDMSFSYIKGRWIDNKEFDENKELAVLKNWEQNAPEKFNMRGGIAC